MQTRRASRLQRVLKLGIAFALVFAGLCMYRYLVRVFEGHWVSHPLVHSILGEGFKFIILTRGQIESPATTALPICGLKAGPLRVYTTHAGHPSWNRSQSWEGRDIILKRSCREVTTTSSHFSDCCFRRADMLPVSCTVPGRPSPHVLSQTTSRRSMSRKRRRSPTRGLYVRCAGVRVDMTSASL